MAGNKSIEIDIKMYPYIENLCNNNNSQVCRQRVLSRWWPLSHCIANKNLHTKVSSHNFQEGGKQVIFRGVCACGEGHPPLW